MAAHRPHVAAIRRAIRPSTSSRSPRSPARSATPSCPAIRNMRPDKQAALAADSAMPTRLSVHAMGVSPAGSLARVMRPTRCATRIACRISSRSLRGPLSDGEGNICTTSMPRRMSGLLDMIMPGWQDYALSIDRMCTSSGRVPMPRPRLRPPLPSGDATTDRLGVASQKDSLRITTNFPARPPTVRARSSAWR